MLQVHLNRFEELGWIDTDANRMLGAGDLQMPGVLRGYQAFHGLEVNGKFDTETEEHLNAQRFCGHPDVMAVEAAQMCRWPSGNISWVIQGQLRRISPADFTNAFKTAFGWWADVCNVTPRNTRGGGNIAAGVGREDGRNGVLAWSQMPCGRVTMATSLRQLYDDDENWIISEDMRGGIDLVRVICHELGHAIGIPHLSAGNLMQPTVDARIRKPQRGDINAAVQRYGRRPTPAPPTPPKPPPGPSPAPTNPCADLLKDLLGELIHTKSGRALTRQAIAALIKMYRENR